MKYLISAIFWQCVLALFLVAEDKNKGEKELFEKQKWRALDILVILLCLYIFRLTIYFLSKYHLGYNMIRDMYLFDLLLILLLIILFKFRFKQSIIVLGFKQDSLRKIIGISIGITFIMYLIINIPITFFVKQSANKLYIVEVVKHLNNPLDYTIYLFSIIIIGPIIEEIISRGVFYSPYRKKYGPLKAIIISSLLFSTNHLGVNFIPFFIVGVLFGFLYEKTESLIAPIIAHSTYNILSFLNAVYLLKL